MHADLEKRQLLVVEGLQGILIARMKRMPARDVRELAVALGISMDKLASTTVQISPISER